MKLTPGPVPVYTVSGESIARPLPDYLARRRKRSLKNDTEYQNRIELLQDFSFEEASACVRVSDDGNWVMSTGTYKPQIHVHSLPELSLSFARHTTSLNHSFVLLSPDVSKSLHLQTDRKLEVHTLQGCHAELRLPRYGRDLVYDRASTEALVPAAGLDADGKGEVFRLSLERGQFLRSYTVDVGGDDDATGGGLQGGIGVGCVNTATIAENTHRLLAFGTSVGTVEFFDPRARTRVATLGAQDGEVTALDFDPSGINIATGSSNGTVRIYDLRRPVPIMTRDQGYGFPIQNILHMTTSSHEKKILTSDKKIIKLWDPLTGDPWTSIEPIVDLHHVAHVKDTGMLFTANEGQQLHSFFIPQLGPAPSWCRFLDSLVEEMAPDMTKDTEVFENYRFVTAPELKSLSVAHLVGKTNLLRPYMHGYFVAAKLYEQARLIANPYVWEEERVKRVKEKIDKERASRIRGTKKVKVNQKLVDKLLQRQEKREKVDTEAGVLGDSRFSKLFEDADFTVDERSREFQVLNPSTKIDAPADGSRADSQSEHRHRSGNQDSDEDSEPIRKHADGISMRVSSSQTKGGRSRDTVFGSRVHKTGRGDRHQRDNVVGEKAVTFVPEKKNKETPEQPALATKRSDARRSASTNTFRKL